MVLHPGGCGRVSYRRQLNKTQLHTTRTREETTFFSRVFSTFYNLPRSRAFCVEVDTGSVVLLFGVRADPDTHHYPLWRLLRIYFVLRFGSGASFGSCGLFSIRVRCLL